MYLRTMPTSLTQMSFSTQFILTVKRSGDSTHPCLSPAPTVSGCDLTPPTRTQTSEQDVVTRRSVKGSRQHRTPARLPKAFPEEPVRMISRGQQNSCR